MVACVRRDYGSSRDACVTPVLQVALLSFAHLCARVVFALAYILGLNTVRTGAWIVGAITNSGLVVLILEKATFKK